MRGPVITVITVCRNAKEALEKTIQNVLGLPYDHIEYIVIDGASNDGTAELISKYAHRLKYWVSEQDKGIYDAMNKGWLHAADNSYIVFLGAGDMIISLPDTNNLKADIIAGEVQIGDKFLFRPKTGLRLMLGNTLHHQALLMRKAVHPTAPFNTDFKTYADFDLNQRLLKSGAKIAIDPTFKAYAMEGGVSTSFNKAESLNVVKSNFGRFYTTLARLYYLIRHEI
jgi:glycosyltransferase involved in cell wall biosynthesis